MLSSQATLNERVQESGIMLLVHRIRSEFLEMPGLRLTPAQAARLWGLDDLTSKRLLDGLLSAGFLIKNKNGAYVRTTIA